MLLAVKMLWMVSVVVLLCNVILAVRKRRLPVVCATVIGYKCTHDEEDDVDEEYMEYYYKYRPKFEFYVGDVLTSSEHSDVLLPKRPRVGSTFNLRYDKAFNKLYRDCKVTANLYIGIVLQAILVISYFIIAKF